MNDERPLQDPGRRRRRRRRRRSRRPTASWPRRTTPTSPAATRSKTERFKEINEAYEVLGDEKKREEYDRLKQRAGRVRRHARGLRPRGVRAGRSAAARFGRGGGMCACRPTSTVTWAISSPACSAAAAGPCAAAVGPARRASSRGPDLVGVLDLDLRARRRSARGSTIAVGERRIDRGAGAAGRRHRRPPARPRPGWRRRQRGRRAGRPAPRDRGASGSATFSATVSDIEMDLPLTVTEAVLGTKVEVPTLEGPRDMSPFRRGPRAGPSCGCAGRGVKRADGTRGDQIVRVQIVVPKLSEDDAESRRLIEEFGEAHEQWASGAQFLGGGKVNLTTTAADPKNASARRRPSDQSPLAVRFRAA